MSFRVFQLAVVLYDGNRGGKWKKAIANMIKDLPKSA